MSVSPALLTVEVDQQELISCPYEKTHQIRRARMPYHLVKCSKQHPDIVLEKCPFDQTHLLPEKEMMEHKKTCSGRARLEEYSRFFSDAQEHDLEVVKKNKVVPVYVEKPDDDDWNGFVGTRTYVPQKAIEEKGIIRCVRGMTKSERRSFYDEQHSRLVVLKNREVIDENKELGFDKFEHPPPGVDDTIDIQ